MDAATQQNAALVEEASAASEAIVGQATQLADLVARYRVAEDVAAAEQPVHAANANTPRMPTQGPAPGVERRSAKRPWSPPGDVPAENNPGANAARVARAVGGKAGTERRERQT